jgi:hypothetical protein
MRTMAEKKINRIDDMRSSPPVPTPPQDPNAPATLYIYTCWNFPPPAF